MIKPSHSHPRTTASPPSLQVVAQYAAALAARDSTGMSVLRTPDFRLDYVHLDAFEGEPLSAQETESFWPAWFTGFPEMDFEITRTIAAETVVVVQWTFTGTNKGALVPQVFGRAIEPTGRTVRLRGLSVYDVSEGLIQRETLYLDYATLWVELGVEL
jgi:predicted ester cyclase